jgi:CheY-like chemotaxis protein
MKFLLLKWQEGVDKALHLPDVILCDIMMPVLMVMTYCIFK